MMMMMMMMMMKTDMSDKTTKFIEYCVRKILFSLDYVQHFPQNY